MNLNTEFPPFDSHGGLSGHRDDTQVRIDFSVSLNAFGPAPHVAAAVRTAVIDEYPDPTSITVRKQASERWKCPPEEIVFGAGASELIYAITRACIRQDDRVLILAPTFGEYHRSARLAGGIVYTVWRDLHNHILDIDTLVTEIRAVRPALTFVCTPNNPTGSTIDRDSLRTIANACSDVSGLLIIDQSYDAFASDPLGTPALRNHPSVVHIRSITKDHALAGIRAGFAIGPAAIMHCIELVRPPWSVSTVAQEATLAALSDQGDVHLSRTIPVLRAERVRIQAACTSYGIQTHSGDTHTLLIDAGHASVIQQALLRLHGIRTRDCTSFSLPTYLRIAARRAPENDILIAALPDLQALIASHSGTSRVQPS